MAVLLIEGFDHLTTYQHGLDKGWYCGSPGSSGTLPYYGSGVGVAGRFGGYPARVNAYHRYGAIDVLLTKQFTPASTIIVGLAVWNIYTSGSNAVLRIQTPNSAANVASIHWYPATGLVTVQDSTGAVILAPANVILANTWHYYELKIVKGAAGSATLKLDGVAAGGPSTGNFGTADMGTVALCCAAANDQSVVTFFDDVYVADTSGAAPRNDFLGDVRVETIWPTGDGASSAWTPNTGGVHYDRVNQAIPDDDTTYVKSATVGNVDTYAATNLAGTAGTIYGVQTVMRARKDDAALRQVAPVIRQGGTDYVGTTQTLAATYGYFTQLHNQDPVAADWTVTNVNANEFGAKVVT